MSLRLQKRPTESTTDLQDENKDEEVTEVTPKNISFKEKIRTWIKLITVEPALFLYLFAGAFAQAAGNNLRFEMGCRVNVGLNDTLCSNYTLGISATSATLFKIKSVNDTIVSVVSGILVLCFSTFSDRHKIRKPFFVLPIFGEVLSCIGLLLCVMFITVWPVETFFVFATIVPACLGGGQTLIMAINSYIADISTIEERTSRVGFVELVALVLTPIGPVLGGILYLYIGYYGILSICAILFLIATLYSWFYIPEKREPIVRTKNTCIDVFNIKAVVIDMTKILISKRIGYRRCLILLTYVCYVMIKGTSTDSFVFQIYSGAELGINPSGFEYYRALDIMTHILGMFLAITIFVRKLKVPDLMLVVIACCFKIISSFWYAFGKSVAMFYIGPVISMFSGIYLIALRSFITKLVNTSEIAKAQALFAICEMIQPLIYNLIYYHFYTATMAKFLGASFLLSAGLIIPPLILALVMHAMYKNDPKDEVPTTSGDQNGNQKEGVYNESNDIETSRL